MGGVCAQVLSHTIVGYFHEFSYCTKFNNHHQLGKGDSRWLYGRMDQGTNERTGPTTTLARIGMYVGRE